MKKIISLTSLLAVGIAAALTPVMMTQNMSLKSSDNKLFIDNKFKFKVPSYDSYVVSAAAQYEVSVESNTTFAYYQIYLNNAGSKVMWKYTTNGPASGHPATNYLNWLTANGPGFNTNLEQTGDYIVSIDNGYQHMHADSYIISDFEKNIGGSLWNKIEEYFATYSTANLELSFQYNGNVITRDGFYTNASWPH